MVIVNGGTRLVDSVSITGSEVRLTLSSAVSAADDVSWLYQEPADPTAPALRDQDGNYAADRGRSDFQDAANETPRSSLQPLTAQFTNVPASHDGQSSVTFNIEFSEPVWVGHGFPRDDLLKVNGGTVTSAHWLERKTRRWAVTIRPENQGNITVVLPKQRYCVVSIGDDTGEADLVPGAPCAAEDRQLSNQPEATIPISQQQAANTPATGGPGIDGSPRAGETLTATTSGIEDDDGMSSAVFAYQWIRQDLATATEADIEGATASTYTVTAEDEGKALKVRVSFTDDAGHEESLTSFAVIASPAVTRGTEAANAPATGAPGINGSPVVGQTLTATTSDIGDDDGITKAVFAYQWIRRGPATATEADIDGAPGTTYTVTAEDEGKTIKVRVTFTDDAGNEESLTSEATAAVAAANSPATGTPTISGTAQAGETLTADTSGIGDADGLTNAVFTYRWLADDAEIAGATGSTYTLAASEQGKALKVRVTFTDDAGHEETLTSTATGAVAAAPSPLTAQASQVPASHDGNDSFTFELRFSEEPVDDFSYRTLRDHAFTMSGGHMVNARRLNPPSNVGWEITVQPSGNAGVTVSLPVTTDCDSQGAVCTGDGRMLSNRLELTVNGPSSQQQAGNILATGAPTITGTAQVGETLTADTSGISDADGLDNATFSYQWLADDADILGATASTYTVAEADEGKAVKVRVSFTDDAGNQESLTSADTDAVAARPNSAATGAPTINGTAQVGETLTAQTSGIADADGLENATFSYQWLADEADISGAAGSAYTLADSDQGKAVRVRVSFTDDAGNGESLTSAATAAVAGAAPAKPPKPTNLTAAVNDDGSVTLNWDAPDDDSVTGYRILRRRPTEGEEDLLVYVENTGSAAATYTDTGVTAGIRHVYRVKAINEAGLSQQSNYVRVEP